jgi:hypothetical protein
MEANAAEKYYAAELPKKLQNAITVTPPNF